MECTNSFDVLNPPALLEVLAKTLSTCTNTHLLLAIVITWCILAGERGEYAAGILENGSTLPSPATDAKFPLGGQGVLKPAYEKLP